jgi:hypothetical protein
VQPLKGMRQLNIDCMFYLAIAAITDGPQSRTRLFTRTDDYLGYERFTLPRAQ